MGNFTYLLNEPLYEMFSTACTDAENVLSSSPSLSAVASRKALELAARGVV